MSAQATKIHARHRAPWAQSMHLDHLRLSRNDRLAVLATAAYCLAATLLGLITGASFSPSTPIMALVPSFFCALAFGYHLVRPAERQLFQILAFSGLWAALPIAGTQLSLIANMAGLPLRSDTFLAIDRTLGFDWLRWATFVQSHPLLQQITGQAYLSYAYQPYVAVIVVALYGPTSRNANFLLATALALGVTIAISALVPAIEPGRTHGYVTPAADTMLAVRNGQRSGLPYIGIICFPSFHAAMACLFVLVYRGLRIPVLIASAVNGVMLLSVPFSGDHYLTDLLAGIAVAVMAQCAANRITRTPSEARCALATDDAMREPFSA